MIIHVVSTISIVLIALLVAELVTDLGTLYDLVGGLSACSLGT